MMKHSQIAGADSEDRSNGTGNRPAYEEYRYLLLKRFR